MHSRRSIAPLLTIGLLVAMLAACSTSSNPTVSKTTEPEWRFHDIVDVAFVRQHVKVPMTETVMLIDARPKKVKYDKGHIPMAVSIPDSQFDKMKDRLPQDKNTLLIYYCGGPKCKLSHKSARKAEALGYKNVKVFSDGFPGWMAVKGHYASVSEVWLKKQIGADADMLVVDARPKRKKYDKGHIPGAISIPDTQFDKYKDKLPRDKDKLLVFYCGGLKCKLSHKSAAKAMAMGHANVKVFSAGYPAWKQIVAGTAPVEVKAGQEEGSIDIAVFKKIMAQNPQSIVLIDVRDKDEFGTGSLKTAINIPVDELEAEIKSLPMDKPIVFICGTGARSGESLLYGAGFKTGDEKCLLPGRRDDCSQERRF